ncbi:MAG: hypothetical protein ACR2M7_02110 [Bdellovibrionales bacterium]
MKISKIHFSPYQLKKDSYSLQGALLAFEFDSSLKGYADFLPWPSFGENSLDQELENIAQGIPSSRFLIAQKNGWLDAQARFKKQNLFYGLQIPPSHFLIENLEDFNKEKALSNLNYKYIKIKLLDSSIEKQAEKLKKLVKDLPKNLRFRLDVGGQKWSVWKKHLAFMKKQIDFIEDPSLDSQTVNKEDHFAQDWIPNLFPIKIAKPSRDSLESILQGVASSRWRKVIFTHSFDHPLGQAASAFWAAQFYLRYPSLFEVSGLKCLSFEDNPFYFHKTKDPFFEKPEGLGFGFDRLLSHQDWERLV